MLKKWSVSRKLVSSFLIVALITAIVGIIGWMGINQQMNSIHNLGYESIPGIIYIEETGRAVTEIQMAIRTLANQGLSEKEAQEQFKKIEEQRSYYKKQIDGYDKLRKNAEENKLYQEFLTRMANAKKGNNAFLDYAKSINRSRVTPETAGKLFDLGMSSALLKEYNDVQDANTALREYVTDFYGKEMVKQSESASMALNAVIITAAVIGFALALILGVVIAGSISRPVNKITDNLFASSGSLEGAASQVSSSSQELSGGASELASSVEEMTSSLEELQSIIESNTKNINEAELLMRQTNEGAKGSTSKMDEMQSAMDEINGNSKKIVKIIKVIDDIAFQTNILALNAAVEAARAGDAGRGFAVVAEQVKNLAQKSAEAAKETADLIDEAIESVSKGEQRGLEVKEVLNTAVELAQKVGVLLDEINRASKEQLKGANQVTKAVSQINSVVQNTAASSEQVASAGEEMLSQSEMLKGIVEKLNSLIKGENAGVHNQLDTVDKEKTGANEHKKTALIDQGSSKILGFPAPLAEIIRPDEKIPLQDFKDF